MLKGGGYMTARRFSLFGYSSLVVSVKGDWAVARVCARVFGRHLGHTVSHWKLRAAFLRSAVL